MGETTIHDVARKAGVSAATVSRALNGGLVKVQTRERVKAVARSMGYTSNSSSRKTSGLRSESIGILVTDIVNFYFADLLKGLFSVAQQSNCRMVIDDLNASDANGVIDRMVSGTVGQIVIAPRLDDDLLRQRFSPVNTVFVSKRLDGYVTACADDRAGMAQAVRHLASLGHKCVAYVGGSEHSWTNTQRIEAFVDSAEQYGLESMVLGPFEPSYGGGVNACDAVMLEHDLTGIIVFNDLMAAGLLSSLQERGLRVPDDLSLVGIDNSVLSKAVRPNLTTVDVRQERLGAAAMRILMDMLHRPDMKGNEGGSDTNPSGLMIPEILLTRDSTGRARLIG